MQQVNIKIQTIEEANEQPEIMPEISDCEIKTAEKITVLIQEQMTAQNKAGVSFVFQHPDGTCSVGLITENLFKTITYAFNGAIDRFSLLEQKRVE